MAVAVEFSDVHRLSTDEFQQMVESGALEDVRVEFINGLLVDMSPPGPEHDGPIEFLNTLLARALDLTRYRLRPQMALSIADSAPQPDIAVVAIGTSQPYYPATAELVIEVSRSSLRRDLIVKPPIYASAGIPEYWVIDVEHTRVLVHREPADQSYRSIQELGQDGILDGSIVGLDPIPIADILAAAQP
jgi:Uma2 family endonuclease